MKFLPRRVSNCPPRQGRGGWGQALVEFALALPILLTIIFLIIEAALVIQGYLAAEHAAREAVRWAIAYQPLQSYRLDGQYCTDLSAGDSLADFLFTDAGYNCDPTESTAEYYNRRVALIKETALARAAGLRINQNALGMTSADFQNHFNEPGFFGVRVWGFPAFNQPEVEDHPGIPGLAVRVQVIHNVEILDPLLRVIVPYVRVEATAEMINEGIQVGFGNVPPPTFQPPPTIIGGGGTSVPTETPQSGSSPTPENVNYQVEIAFTYVTNQVPLQRAHNVTVTVTDENDVPQPNVLVNFSTNLGSWDQSGVGPQMAEVATDSNGVAIKTIYANELGTANIRVWIDLDGDDTWDMDEPYDQAQKEWIANGPYVLASKYQVSSLEWIAVDIYDHPPSGNPYTLIWCRTSITGGIASRVLVTDTINVDNGTWDYLDLPIEIPSGSDGYYRLETHSSPSTCGNTSTLVGYSSDILVTAQPPDLHIQSLSYSPQYANGIPPYVPVPISITVENLSPTTINGTFFDIDYYLDLQTPPPLPGQIGNEKQWLLNIGPYGTRVVTALFTLEPGIHEMWAQVDSTDYIVESNEANNIGGPYTLDVRCTASSSPYGDDFNDGVFASKWTAQQIGSSNVYGNVTEANEHLTINARGRRIWGDGGNENFYYIHQSISGDFDARLRVLSTPSNNQWSKVGLMIRNSTASNSRHAMLMGTRSHGLQFAYRPSDGADTSRAADDLSVSFPIWVRLVRSGDTIAYYYSTATDPHAGDWVYRASVSIPMNDTVLVGIAHASYSTSSSGTSEVDEFTICQSQGTSPSESKPPGLIECTQLLQVGGFEGNPESVLTYWQGGDVPGAFVRSGYLQFEGTFSMRLTASRSSYPECTPFWPYLFQTVQIPSDVLTLTHLTVEGQRAIGGSQAECSVYNSVDADDTLYVQIREGNGTPISNSVPIANGGVVSETWEPFSVDFTNDIDLLAHAGQNVQIYFSALHDQDEYGTWFYLDDLEANVCTHWPIPDPVPGTASIGGLIRMTVGGVPQPLSGADVWTYSQGGQVYHTTSIHDGTYHFYNIPPGTYTVYAEAWVSGVLKVATSTVTVVADERNYNVHLLVQ